MKKTSSNTWEHKGWGIEFFGDGYKVTRLKIFDGKFITATADTLEEAENIIDDKETKIDRAKNA